jgi:CHASE2 domain-containing sensor protein
MTAKKAVFLGAGTLLLLAAVFAATFLGADDLFYSANFAAARGTAPDSVVIVGIDTRSIEKVGGWPWPRATLAQLFDRIESGAPRAVALDMLFPWRDDSLGNDSLARVFARMNRLVLPFKVTSFAQDCDGVAANIPPDVLRHRFMLLSNQAALAQRGFYCASEIALPDTVFARYAQYGGFLNVSTLKSSQRLRELIHVIKVGGEYFPSFGISATAAYLGLKPDEVVLDGAPRVRLGERTLPLTSYAGSAFVNFRGKAGTVRTISAGDLITGAVDPSTLANRLVFVGITEQGVVADFVVTPVGSQYPGVEVWATAVLDILQHAWIRYGGGVRMWAAWLLALLIFPGLAIMVPHRLRVLALAGGGGALLASVVTSLVLFREAHYFWSPLPHALAWVFSLVWITLQKGDPALAGSSTIEMEPREDAAHAIPPPPTSADFLSEIPDMESARFVAGKLSAAGAQAAVNTTMAEGGTPITAASAKAVLEQVRTLCNGTIVRPLGSGGMADVYLVWHPRMEVYRAVKVLKPGQPERILTRFETEIRILSNLNHTNIVQCLSVGEWFGLPYLEMEFVYGASLEDVVAKCGVLTPAQVAVVGILVCRALHYAHRQVVTIYGNTYRGVIHRDLKPANIMLSKGGRIKLTDFGIARPSEVSLHTVDAGTIVGTLPYLSPEQAEGRPLTGRSDIYSLGATLYELLCGQRAFPQPEVTSLLTAKAMGTVKPLSPAGGVPAELAAIVNKAMSQKEEDRYDTALTMGKELARVFRTISKDEGYVAVQQLVTRMW